MPNVINGTSTGSGGLITSGDDSGILNIQTNETTAMSIDASQSVDFTNNIDAPNTFGFKNRIINGAMVIDQRNAGAAVTNSAAWQYVVDRFAIYGSQGSKFTGQQSTTAPDNFINSFLLTSSSSYASLANDEFLLKQIIEGFNVSDLNWGSASAQTVTLSFWARSSLTGTWSGVIKNAASNRSFVFTYTISSANTWEYKTVTITGDTTGTWLKNNDTGIQVWWDLGSGSTYRTASTNTWLATGVDGATGANSLVGTNGATLYITGVQLEKGTQATSFDFRDYGRELMMCQRYFYKTGGATNGAYTIYSGYTAGIFGNTYFYPVVMRASPTVSISGTFTVSNCAQPTFLPAANDNMLVYSTATATGTAYFAGGASVSVSAEL